MKGTYQFVVQWIRSSGNVRVRVRESGHDDLAHALAEYLRHADDPYVEYVTLVSDKGDGAPVRGGREFKSAWEVAAWMNEPIDSDR